MNFRLKYNCPVCKAKRGHGCVTPGTTALIKGTHEERYQNTATNQVGTVLSQLCEEDGNLCDALAVLTGNSDALSDKDAERRVNSILSKYKLVKKEEED